MSAILTHSGPSTFHSADHPGSKRSFSAQRVGIPASLYDQGHDKPPKLITSSPSATLWGCLVESLIEIGENVINVLDAHAKPKHFGCNTHPLLFVGRQLPVCRGRRMAGQ